jgi:hypothetical protein
MLDWFHVTMRITVLRQFTQGLRNDDEEAGNELLGMLSRIKCYLRHGNKHRAREEISGLFCDAESVEADYPNMRKFLKAIGEFSLRRSYPQRVHQQTLRQKTADAIEPDRCAPPFANQKSDPRRLLVADIREMVPRHGE